MDIEKTLCSLDPADLRKDKKLRNGAAKESKEILDRMGAYMGEKKD